MEKFTPEYFDSKQYTKTQIAKYESIYGRNFISPGGERTSTAFLKRLGLKRGMRVLDIGCGIGGSAFQMARKYGVGVDAIDISRNMIEIGHARCKEEGLEDQVRLFHGDCLEMDYDRTYDAVHSRDVFLHIHDKNRLFSLVQKLLLPKGILAFTDYCCGKEPASREFNEYVEERGYCLHTVDEYRRLLEQAGFVQIQVEDRTDQFIEIHQRELANLSKDTPGAEDADDLTSGWTAKIQRAQEGEQRWGWFMARKPVARDG